MKALTEITALAHALGKAQDLRFIFRRLFFLRENSLPTAPFYGHLVFRGVECKDCRTLDLEFIFGRRFEGDRG
jgi:hypothetical protein